MSVQAMSWVFDHSPAEMADRLVLLSIANHAGQSPDDGCWEAWPGVATIAREARVDPRTVTNALSRLVAAGHLERVVNGAPDQRARADRRTNLYRIPIHNGVSCGDTRCPWCSPGRGVVPEHNGVSSQNTTGCRPTTGKPSRNHQEPSSSALTVASSEPSPVDKSEDEMRVIAEKRALAAYRAQTHTIINPQAWIAKAIENELDRLRLEPPALRLCGECDNGWLLADNGDAVRCECRRSA